jgi:ABC-type antimicrobial peptide transport system ATPase subunit
METESRDESINDLPMEMQKVLKNTHYPAKRNEIIENERRSAAIPDVLVELGMLPDKQYNNAEDVAKEIHRIYIGIPA